MTRTLKLTKEELDKKLASKELISEFNFNKFIENIKKYLESPEGKNKFPKATYKKESQNHKNRKKYFYFKISGTNKDKPNQFIKINTFGELSVQCGDAVKNVRQSKNNSYFLYEDIGWIFKIKYESCVFSKTIKMVPVKQIFDIEII